MKRVNLCAASIPQTPCALTRALAHALRQSASNVIDARLTQPTQAGDVRANLNAGASEAPEGRRRKCGGMGRISRQFFGDIGHHHQKAQSLAGSRVSTGSAGSLRRRQGEARCGR